MKTTWWSFTLLLLSPFSIHYCMAQDLSQLISSAHYTLINTADDALGLQQPVTLTNAPFSGNEGVYSNGIYVGNDPSGSLIQTPFMEALYDSVFAVQVEFRLTGLDNTIRPVVVCGLSSRYLGFGTWPDTSFYALYNNANYLFIPEIHPSADNWYEITILHHTPSSLTEWYLDGVKVNEINIPLDRNLTDGSILNINPSSGQTFKGYLRNLRVYGSEEITAIHDIKATMKGLEIYPNPTDANLYVDCMDSNIRYWRIRDQKGVIVKSGETTFGLNELNTHELIPGSYVIDFLDTNLVRIGGKQFFKAK